MKLAYHAVDAAGKAVAGTTEAADILDGIESLRKHGLFVSRIDPAGAQPAATAHKVRRGSRFGKLRRMKHLAMFARQLYVLVCSGTPLVEALGALQRQAREPGWRQVIADLRARVEQGEPLSRAMEAHPEYFDAVCRSLLAAGESGGSFDQMLDRLASLTRKQVQLRNAIRGSMIYPSLLIVVASGVLVLMLTFVLPRFAGLFQSLDVPLPPTTKFLMALSYGLRNYWWALLTGIIGGAIALKFWISSTEGRRAVHTFVVRAPILGPIVRSFAIARVIRVLGVLIVGKVPLLEALGLTRLTAGNVHYMKLVSAAENAVTNGSTVSAVFAESDLVNPSLAEAIRSGEQSGQLGSLLLSMADFLDEENEVVIKSLTSIIEPLILIGLGLVVGFIAMSMFLPLFDLTSMTQRG